MRVQRKDRFNELFQQYIYIYKRGLQVNKKCIYEKFLNA